MVRGAFGHSVRAVAGAGLARARARCDDYSGPGKPFGGEVLTVFFGDREDRWIFSLHLPRSPGHLFSRELR